MSRSLSVDVGKGLWQYGLAEGVGNDVCKGTLAIIALSQLASLVESMCKWKTRAGTASTGGLARMDGFRSALSLSVYDTVRLCSGRVTSLPLRGGFCGEPRSMTFGVRRRLFVIACCALGLVVAGIDVALIYLSFRRPSPVNADVLLRSSLFIRQSGDASHDGLIGV
jgi:hypothetical protein